MIFHSNPVTHFVKPTAGRMIGWLALFVTGHRYVELIVVFDDES
jgi:hypothetical protein